jgi:hypothetical protein
MHNTDQELIYYSDIIARECARLYVATAKEDKFIKLKEEWLQLQCKGIAAINTFLSLPPEEKSYEDISHQLKELKDRMLESDDGVLDDKDNDNKNCDDNDSKCLL